jgi:trigger factor
MDVKIEDKKGLEKNIIITIPASESETFFNQRYEELSKTAKIQGFREGHVPLDVVKKRYADQVREEVTNHMVNTTLSQAIADNKLSPATQPHVHRDSLIEEGKDYNFSAHFEIMPEVKPKKYTDLKLTRKVAEADDKAVDEVLERLKASKASYKEKKGKLTKGDRAIIDTIGYLGTSKDPFPGTSMKNHPVVIGSNSLIPGFEEELIGLSAGDEKTFDITFPKEYHSPELSGKKTKFEVKVIKVESPEETKIDDTFAAGFGAKDMAELKQKIKEQVNHDISESTYQDLKKDMFDQLTKSNKFDVPEGMVSAEFESIWNSQLENLKQQGLSFKEIGKNEDDVKAEYKELAVRRVQLGLLITEIAKQEKIDVTQEEIRAEIDRVAAQYGPQADEIKQRLASPEMRNQIFGPLFEKKVVDWLIENNTVTEKKVKADEIMKAWA